MDSLARRFLVLLLFALLGCEERNLSRPFGTLRLLPVSKLSSDEQYFPKLDLLLRRDQRGWYIMSTVDPTDLVSLKGKQSPEGVRWFSAYSNHVFDNSGVAVSGDTKARLPFFTLQVEPGPAAAPEPWLYVRIGEEQDSNWRFVLPQSAVRQNSP